MREITIEAEVRTQLGKHSRRLRHEGKVPGVYYVAGEQNIPITVAEKSLKPLIFTSEAHIINLKLNDGVSKNCILRDIQFDPVTDLPIHIDLLGLREDRKISIEVPVTITGGTPVGVREGGILHHFIHRLKISCLPKNIPEHLEVSAENLKINQFVHVRDLKLENVTILENETSPIVGVMPPIKETEVAPAVVEETLEPEVIAKGKKPEEEEGEGAETGKKAEPEKKVEADKKAEAAPKQPAAPDAKGAKKK